MCCHCLLIEADDGLILVDTGFGVNDVVKPQQLGLSFRLVSQAQLKIEETAVYQLNKLGFKRGDVKHIVLTHLDLDHAGGLSDFPDAKVHAHYHEIDAALAPRHWKEKARYRPHQFAHQPRWQDVLDSSENWFGFEQVKRLRGVRAEILLVPLAGHTDGHCGVAVRRANGTWLFHVGDLSMDRRSLTNSQPKAIRNVENMLAKNNQQRLQNLKKVKRLIDEHAHEVDVFCAHDINEYRQHAF